MINIPSFNSRIVLNGNILQNVSSVQSTNIHFKCFAVYLENNDFVSFANEYELQFENHGNSIFLSTDWNTLQFVIDFHSIHAKWLDFYSNMNIKCSMNSSSIVLLLNSPPINGYCFYEMNDDNFIFNIGNYYNIYCNGWSDIEGNYPLFYIFILDETIFLSDIQITSYLENIFIITGNHSITVQIYDEYLYAYATYTLDIIDDESIDEYYNYTQMRSFLWWMLSTEYVLGDFEEQFISESVFTSDYAMDTLYYILYYSSANHLSMNFYVVSQFAQYFQSLNGLFFS